MTDPKTGDGLLEGRDLSKAYRGASGEVAALAGVSLRAAVGEFVAVCGPSGCGKSTLLFVLGALLRPDAGVVELGGGKPYELSAAERAGFRARNIGFVFQDFHLVPYLDVLDNVLSPTLALAVPDARARAGELLSHLGLADRLRHVPSALSAGEQQRAALARALLPQPKLVLADEPTGNLDRENATRVLDNLAEYARGGATVLMVTHDEGAMEAADRRVMMDNGRITGEEIG